MLTSKNFGLQRRNPLAPKSDSCSKVKPKKCGACREPFTPVRPLQSACSPKCAQEIAERKRLKEAAKREQEERAKTRVLREKMKTRSQWMKEAQAAFNAFIRARDADLPCICCGKSNDKDYLTGSAWDAGHYRSTGSAPHMRFIENNVHRQLVQCNRNKAGNAVNYRIGLIARIGLEAVEALEADNTVRKYTIEDLKAIKAEYKAKLKQLQRDKEVA